MPKERWPGGGYIHRQKDGRALYIIERRIGRKRYHVSTRAHSQRAADKQLEAFEADPDGYVERMQGAAATTDGLFLTEELALKFREWMTTREDPPPTSVKHANEMGNRLADWMEDLAGVDLRHVTLKDHLKPSLKKRVTCRQHRIIAIKAFYKWLRKEADLLTSKEDPTLDLSVPQAVPEKHKRRKAVPLADIRKVAPELPQPYLDVLTVMADTGMHVTELERFVRSADSELLEAKKGDTIAVMVFRHKRRKLHSVGINKPEVLAAAKRLKERGEVPRRLNDVLKLACQAAGVKPFTYGVMRHTVATWLEEQNVPASQAIKLTGHASEETYKNFYADVEIPVRGFKTPDIL